MLTNYDNATLPQVGDRVVITGYYDFITPNEKGLTGVVVAHNREVYAVRMTISGRIVSFNWKNLYNIDL